MDNLSRLFMAFNMRIGGIDLLTVAEVHNNEILLPALVIGVHWRVVLPDANWACAFNEIDALHLCHKFQIVGAEDLDIGPRFQVEAAKHMKLLINLPRL